MFTYLENNLNKKSVLTWKRKYLIISSGWCSCHGQIQHGCSHVKIEWLEPCSEVRYIFLCKCPMKEYCPDFMRNYLMFNKIDVAFNVFCFSGNVHVIKSNKLSRWLPTRISDFTILTGIHIINWADFTVTSGKTTFSIVFLLSHYKCMPWHIHLV